MTGQPPITCPEALVGGDLVVRRHTPDDVGAFAVFLQDPTATRHMAFTPEQKTAAGAEAMIAYVISSYDTADEVVSLTIADANDDRYLGSVGAAPTEEDGICEIYFTVMPNSQRRGIATRATAALIDHLFEECDVAALRADVVTENRASIRVLEKLGFTADGAVSRDAAGGELAHTAMAGDRYRLTRRNWSVGRRSGNS